MKNNFIVTATNIIEGCKITDYLETICTNVVIGTNIFSDFTASLSDIFGGHSSTYKRKLSQIYEEATSELKDKARMLGANAIIGFNIDFDEISGNGKSMFMISASGTACIVDYPFDKNLKDNNVLDISKDALSHEIRRRYIIGITNEDMSVTNSWMEFLIQYPQLEVLDIILKMYIKSYDGEFWRFVNKYISLLPQNEIIENIYKLYINNKNCEHLRSLIRECDLFSPIKVLDIIKIDIEAGLALFDADMPLYTKSDLDGMKELLQYLDNLPNTGRIEVVKGGFMGKDKEKFICQNGHKSDKDSEFCESCGVNIKGITRNQIGVIEEFRNKVCILEELLNK